MQNRSVRVVALMVEVVVFLTCAPRLVRAQTHGELYPTMAPLGQYLIADQESEIALARSAAPKSLSDSAEVMILGPKGYTTVVKGSNGFLCLVERSWGAATDDPEFWNPKVRSPICFNPQACKSVVPVYLLKTRLALAGKSKSEIAEAIGSAFQKRSLQPPEPGAMCYMMSKQQYLNDRDMTWHPHLMFFVAGDAAKSWGANLMDSPIMAANDPQEQSTIFFVWVGQWSDGTPAPSMAH